MYKYYTTKHPQLAVSYVYRCKVVRDGFMDDNDFHITIVGKEYQSIAKKIIKTLNKKRRAKP